MNALQATSLSFIDFEFTNLLHNHNLILILGLIALFIAVILRAFKTIAIEGSLLLLLFASEEVFSNPMYAVLAALQVLLSLWVFWKMKEAIDITYFRHSEKTLKRPRDITKGGSAGTHHFLL